MTDIKMDIKHYHLYRLLYLTNCSWNDFFEIIQELNRLNIYKPNDFHHSFVEPDDPDVKSEYRMWLHKKHLINPRVREILLPYLV
jgi:hypothetical protein